MTARRCVTCLAVPPPLSAAEAYEEAQEPTEHPQTCDTCQDTPGWARHLFIAGRCVYCGTDDHSIGNTLHCPARSETDQPLVWSSELGARRVVETESGSRYLIDVVASTATRLPANTGGDPLPIEPWTEHTSRADGRLRGDEQPVTMSRLPRPWPPVIGEPLEMVLELVPGVATIRRTSTVTDTITVDH